MKSSLKFATVPLALLSMACNNTPTDTAPGGPVSIAITQALTGQTTSAGSFQMTGALADRGATTESLVFGGPLEQSPVPLTFRRQLTGADGDLVITGAASLTFSSTTAATLAGTWTVESATGKYAGYTGTGTLSGNANFGATPPTAAITYAGTLAKP